MGDFVSSDKQYLKYVQYHKGIIIIIIMVKLRAFGLVWFYGISTIVGYLMPNPLYTNIFNIFGLVWFGFMAYQPL